MNALIIIATALLAGYSVPPEPDAVSEIRAHYSQVKSMMEDEYGMYRTVIEINPTGVPYPAVGNYYEEITLYWIRQAETGEKNLLFASINAEHAAWSDYTEILYGYDGEVMFTFYTAPTYDGSVQEIRRYFSEGREIHATCRITIDGTEEYIQPPEEDPARDPEDILGAFRLLD
ncbi:MAG: hypothetical protein GF388_09925 [Candidatus Aegiribacteria sp.]|nr:hypothetical protein [Candidatus Aegiribacteria sp.]MBD3295350.1 hypothetical protein [Candidatus Fermentibacteria bacterium]